MVAVTLINANVQLAYKMKIGQLLELQAKGDIEIRQDKSPFSEWNLLRNQEGIGQCKSFVARLLWPDWSNREVEVKRSIPLSDFLLSVPKASLKDLPETNDDGFERYMLLTKWQTDHDFGIRLTDGWQANAVEKFKKLKQVVLVFQMFARNLIKDMSPVLKEISGANVGSEKLHPGEGLRELLAKFHLGQADLLKSEGILDRQMQLALRALVTKPDGTSDQLELKPSELEEVKFALTKFPTG